MIIYNKKWSIFYYYFKARTCEEPADILNGHKSSTCHYFTCKVVYHCQAGFELLGKAEYNCLSDGTWNPSDLPTCVRESQFITPWSKFFHLDELFYSVAVQCPIPESPVYGKSLYTSVTFNSFVNYECKYGYMLVGDGNRRCGADKKWTGPEPVCKGDSKLGSPCSVSWLFILFCQKSTVGVRDSSIMGGWKGQGPRSTLWSFSTVSKARLLRGRIVLFVNQMGLGLIPCLNAMVDFNLLEKKNWGWMMAPILERGFLQLSFIKNFA